MSVEAKPADAPARSPLYKSLSVQVVAALILGVVLGMARPGFAVGLKFFSDAFFKLISVIVAPIVFCVVVHGIAGASNLKKVGRVGGKALLYFEVMTTVALVVGLVLAFLIRPGEGMNIDTASLDARALGSYAENAHKLQGGGIGSFILNIVPTTSFDALARNGVLQVLFFAIIFGISAALVGEAAQPVISLIDTLSKIPFRAMGLIVRAAPLGVLGAVAYTVGQYGVGSLEQLLSLVVVFWIAVALFVVVVLGTVMRVATGLNILRFLAYFREELTIVLALVLVLSIDWFIGVARALGNLIGNCVATVVIAAWEKDLNVPLAKQVLAGDVVVDIVGDMSAMPLAPEQPA